MVYRKNTTKNKNRIVKVALPLILIAALLVGGVFAYNRYSNKSAQTTDTALPEQKLNLDPPTEQDLKAADEYKEEVAKNEQSAPAPQQPGTLKTVGVVIVDASQYDQQVEVRAYISGVIENGGTCTYSFTNGSAKVTKQTKATADATTTRCPTLDVPKSEFATGQWSVTVTYSSSTAQGSSQAKSFEVK